MGTLPLIEGGLRSFNPSIEGQPLQLEYRGPATETTVRFQSLYRGTAFATSLAEALGYITDQFQSLYRGTAFATESLQKP